jgi:hypothetical protein
VKEKLTEISASKRKRGAYLPTFCSTQLFRSDKGNGGFPNLFVTFVHIFAITGSTTFAHRTCFRRFLRFQLLCN